MANSEVEIRVEGEDNIKILGRSFGKNGIDLLLRDAMEDIADKIEDYAKIFAPEGKTGELKTHPTDRIDIHEVVTSSAAFGGGLSIRGGNPLNTGQFSKGVGADAGQTTSHIEISVAKEPEHAIWVHQGTGVHHIPFARPELTPKHSPYMVFFWRGSWHKRRTVLGQKPQPFLTDAYEFVDHNYVPKRVEQLKLAIDALT